MSRIIWTIGVLCIILHTLSAAPVDPKKGNAQPETGKEKENEPDDFGLEYGKYLQEVVQVLEQDKEFAKKLENVSSEQIRNGKIAEELQFVNHKIRGKLDELKRMEVDRLRKLVREQMEQAELGINRSKVKLPQHVDVGSDSFEISDLKKLIQTATKDLEELDKQRREEFKKYEMEKEMKYRESLVNMTDDKRKETVKHHEELVEKHKDHPKVHHPGSKPQLEQVWEEEDHLPKDEFNPKTFFAMHDINGDGHLDENEIEAVLIPEVRKMYDSKNEEDDPIEMEEEYHRMREHIFNETDLNRDGLISLKEFLQMTEQQEFERDEGWKGLDEQPVYSEAELEEYMRQRHLAMGQQYYGDPRMYYDVPHGQPQGVPPHINYQAPHPNMPPQQQPQYHAPAYPQGHPQQFQGVPQQQQHYQGMQQQYQQGMPQQHYQGSQQAYQGVPQQHYQGVQGIPQQQHQGIPQQQHQGIPQQQHQGIPQQQHQGIPQQQHQGIPQQQHQGIPQQQHQGIPQQQHQGIQQQQYQGVPQHQGVPQQHQRAPEVQHIQVPGEQRGQLNNPAPPQPSNVNAAGQASHPGAATGQNVNEIPRMNVPNPNPQPAKP